MLLKIFKTRSSASNGSVVIIRNLLSFNNINNNNNKCLNLLKLERREFTHSTTSFLFNNNSNCKLNNNNNNNNNNYSNKRILFISNNSKATNTGTILTTINSKTKVSIVSNRYFGTNIENLITTKGTNSSMPPVEIEKYVQDLLKNNKIVIFSKTTCPYCVKAKDLLDALKEKYLSLNLDEQDNGTQIRDYLFEKTGQKTVPNIFINGKHVGGCDNLYKANADGRLTRLLNAQDTENMEKYDYDLIVIGGGSGGLACAKMAANYGAKVACLDYVVPTPIGTTWGLGGTCVNVGCIPKKLMHQSAILGESIKDSEYYGWKLGENKEVKHDWETMKENIQNYIGSLNWGYRVQLRDKKVEYINAFAKFVDTHKLLITKKNGKTQEITGNKIVVAVGGRPKYAGIPGDKEYGITSDDLFSLPYNPGKTLCVGASYVSLECAGFLHGLGLDVTVMVRSILLRGFDQQMANMIGKYMEEHGIKFIREAVPTEIIRIKEGQPGELLVKYKLDNGQIAEETFNTVVFAIGRDVCTSNINLEQVGVKLNPKNGKIKTNFEQTSVENIYAIGDVIDESTAHGRFLELTPVAIKAGQLLAKRLFDASDVKMDYYAVPTTVFTPIEYGNIGFSEEEAIQAFGEDNIEVYHSYFWPLEWTLPKKPENACYLKLICNKADNERVIGLHVLGPNAGEITQGYAVAIKMRATKHDFDMTVGIHPTCSENFTTLLITKRSGKDISVAGC